MDNQKTDYSADEPKLPRRKLLQVAGTTALTGLGTDSVLGAQSNSDQFKSGGSNSQERLETSDNSCGEASAGAQTEVTIHLFDWYENPDGLVEECADAIRHVWTEQVNPRGVACYPGTVEIEETLDEDDMSDALEWWKDSNTPLADALMRYLYQNDRDPGQEGHVWGWLPNLKGIVSDYYPGGYGGVATGTIWKGEVARFSNVIFPPACFPGAKRSTVHEAVHLLTEGATADHSLGVQYEEAIDPDCTDPYDTTAMGDGNCSFVASGQLPETYWISDYTARTIRKTLSNRSSPEDLPDCKYYHVDTVGDAKERPTNLDYDPQLEDVNGNGRLDYDDVVTFFENKDGETVQNNPTRFDYNQNGRIDYDDIVTLFHEL